MWSNYSGVPSSIRQARRLPNGPCCFSSFFDCSLLYLYKNGLVSIVDTAESADRVGYLQLMQYIREDITPEVLERNTHTNVHIFPSDLSVQHMGQYVPSAT